jgi:hypothetical protein
MFHIYEVPAAPVLVGEDEEGVRVVPKQAGHDGTLGAQEELAGGKPGVYDVKIAIFRARCKQRRVFC